MTWVNKDLCKLFQAVTGKNHSKLESVVPFLSAGMLVWVAIVMSRGCGTRGVLSTAASD